MKRIAWAIQNHVDPKCVERYLTGYDASRVKSELQNALAAITVDGAGTFLPILHFAAEQNSADYVRILCKAGADPSQRARPSGLPVLAYAVLCAEYNALDTTNTVLALLAMGASPEDVPKDMWQEYLRAPKRDQPTQLSWRHRQHEWCTPEVREVLCNNLNLMQRYSLYKANGIKRPTPRRKQIAEAYGVMSLFEVPYHIIGQPAATQQVVERITSHLLLKSTRPLVLLLTGTSGHGKTELARRMGNLLSLEILSVDCTEMRCETDMFGPKAPYAGHEEGSRLNNYLCQQSGQRAVVFLDEFDKTDDEVRQALLMPLEDGTYIDRRKNAKVDCKDTIWILAANLGSVTIAKFWDAHLKGRSEDQQTQAPFKSLQRFLEKDAISKFGAPITGRLSAIVPFLPFSKEEQAVVAYKFMRELWNEVRKPINTASKDFARHLFLHFADDGQIAKYLADQYYNPALGARSLENAVGREIKDTLAQEFLEEEARIADEMNEGRLLNYEIRVVSGPGDLTEIVVKLRGMREIQAPREPVKMIQYSPGESSNESLSHKVQRLSLT